MTLKQTPETPKNKENRAKIGLNPDQTQAVQAPSERPLLIVAGAGTGKTRTLTTRVAHFIHGGVEPDRICAITFTNKAAREMESRIHSILKDGHLPPRGMPFIGTFHALGARILRRYAALLGRTPDFVIFDDHDSFALVRKALKDLDRKKEAPGAILNKISAIKNGAPAEEMPPLVRAVYERYEAALQSQNAFDFDDLLSKTVLLFKKRPDILARYQEQFTHILIDEYQDLNDTQYELVRLLAADGASVSVVGDAEQTIYGWRGSNIEIFLRFPEDWAEAEMVTLNQNYRSTQNILRAASGVIQQNEYATKVKRATDLWTENPPGERVKAAELLNEDAEAEYIAEKILVARAKGEEGITAILYRTNAQSRALEQALLRRRIPYRVYGGLKFYERREIKDVVAALRYTLNPQDLVAKERLEKTFAKRRSAEIASALRAAESMEPLKLIEAFLRAADYLSYIERNMTNARDRRENIEELIHFAAGYRDLAKFLEEIALLQATDNVAKTAEPENEVVLMTIHLAKGLEFDRVFVAGVAEGLLPHARSLGSKEELQEERRLMYVAMTRARRELYLTFFGIPSRFLGEIPAEAVEFESMLTADGSLYIDDEYEERYISLD